MGVFEMILGRHNVNDPFLLFYLFKENLLVQSEQLITSQAPDPVH